MVTIGQIAKLAALVSGVPLNRIRGRSRVKRFVAPRHAAMYCASKHTSLSLEEIGEYFDGRDHASVWYAI